MQRKTRSSTPVIRSIMIALAVAFTAPAVAATVTVTDGTTAYRVTTITGTPSDLAAQLRSQPWYTGTDDAALGGTLAADLGPNEFGTPHTDQAGLDACNNAAASNPAIGIPLASLCLFTNVYGPYFAYDLDDAGSALSVAVNGLGLSFNERTTSSDAVATFAVVDMATVPVPAGLPLLLTAMGALALVRRRRSAR